MARKSLLRSARVGRPRTRLTAALLSVVTLLSWILSSGPATAAEGPPIQISFCTKQPGYWPKFQILGFNQWGQWVATGVQDGFITTVDAGSIPRGATCGDMYGWWWDLHGWNDNGAQVWLYDSWGNLTVKSLNDSELHLWDGDNGQALFYLD
jgi:hypothetical protein